MKIVYAGDLDEKGGITICERVREKIKEGEKKREREIFPTQKKKKKKKKMGNKFFFFFCLFFLHSIFFPHIIAIMV